MNKIPFAIKINERFFYKYENDRVNTAWSLAGAKIFLDGTATFEKIRKVLNSKKVKYEKAYVGIITPVINVDEPKKINKEEIISKVKKTCAEVLEDDDLPF